MLSKSIILSQNNHRLFKLKIYLNLFNYLFLKERKIIINNNLLMQCLMIFFKVCLLKEVQERKKINLDKHNHQFVVNQELKELWEVILKEVNVVVLPFLKSMNLIR